MKWLFPTLLTAFVVVFRFAGIEYSELLNVTPLFALFLCFRKELSEYLFIPISGFLLSDFILSFHYGHQPNSLSMLVTCLALCGAYMIGNIKNFSLLGKTFIATTGFFVLTSTMAWHFNPAYGSGWLNWVSAIVIGEPGYPPAYLFYLKSLLGNFGFAFVFDLATKYHLSKENDNSLHMLS